MDLWMGAFGIVFLLTGALQAFFADEIGKFFRERHADDFFTNDKIWRYVGYAGIAFGAVILAIAYLLARLESRS
jgi:hypothetical protein